MYRPEIKVLDCTIRDGGLMNDWHFDKALVKGVFHNLALAGVDYVELGYRADKRQFSTDTFGPWRFCDESDLREVAYECDTKVSIMCDVGRTDLDTFLPADQSIVRMVRVATYIADIEKAIEMVRFTRDLGYEVCVNIMAISHVLEPDLDRALDRLASEDFDTIYLVDSFGNMYSEQIHYYCEKYMSRMPGKQVGIHAHNNLQLGFANTVEALLKGATFVDATVYGMGRAAGNCPLELIMAFLKNPKFDVRPVLDLVQRYFEPLLKELRWGYEIPYAVTGMLNKHPKAAMAFMQGVHGSTYSEFYEGLINAEE